MTVLVLASFQASAAAERAAVGIVRLCRAGEASTHGAASARWHVGAPRPAVRHYPGDPAVGGVDWRFWGLVLGIALSLPLAAAARGSAGGLAAQMLGDVGIADELLNRLRDDVVPGRSALLVLAPEAGCARLVDALREQAGRTHWLELADAEDRALWAAFAA